MRRALAIFLHRKLVHSFADPVSIIDKAPSMILFAKLTIKRDDRLAALFTSNKCWQLVRRLPDKDEEVWRKISATGAGTFAKDSAT
jgi:hypothetical protein